MVTLVCLDVESYSSAFAMPFGSCPSPVAPPPPPLPPSSGVESTYDTFYSVDYEGAEPVVIDTGMDTVKVTCHGCFCLRMYTLCMLQNVLCL